MSDHKLIPDFPDVEAILEESPKYKKAVIEHGPEVIGVAATVVSGNHVVGAAAKIGASAASSASPDKFAEGMTVAGIAVGAVVITVLATPIFPFLLLGALVKSALSPGETK